VYYTLEDKLYICNGIARLKKKIDAFLATEHPMSNEMVLQKGFFFYIYYFKFLFFFVLNKFENYTKYSEEILIFIIFRKIFISNNFFIY
jgi:hypothetical protein